MIAKQNEHEVNPHYIDRVVDLGNDYDVCSDEDIFKADGVKLISKGTKITPAAR